MDIEGRRPCPSRLAAVALVALACAGSIAAQSPFPAGLPQETYLCPRIDLLPAGDGGPLAIVLDGVLDEAAWARAHWETTMNVWGTAPTTAPTTVFEELRVFNGV